MTPTVRPALWVRTLCSHIRRCSEGPWNLFNALLSPSWNFWLFLNLGRAWGEGCLPSPPESGDAWQFMQEHLFYTHTHTHTLQNLLGCYELQWISKWKIVLFRLITVSVRPTHTHLTFLIYCLKVTAMHSGPQILPLLLDWKPPLT